MVEHTCFTGIYNDIAEILLKLPLNTNQSINLLVYYIIFSGSRFYQILITKIYSI